MRQYEKVYKAEDVANLIRQVEELAMKVGSLQDTMTNSRPWSAHWLGGDIKNGATEVRPARFQAARDAVRRATDGLETASHELAMLETEILHPKSKRV